MSHLAINHSKSYLEKLDPRCPDRQPLFAELVKTASSISELQSLLSYVPFDWNTEYFRLLESRSRQISKMPTSAIQVLELLIFARPNSRYQSYLVKTLIGMTQDTGTMRKLLKRVRYTRSARMVRRILEMEE